jgi:hypothetical protein
LAKISASARLDDLAVGHHADPVGDLRTMPRSWVMNSIAMPCSRFSSSAIQDLRLHGDVERRGRLVGDQQFGLVGQRHGDHHALPLPARQLVRIGLEPLSGIADADLVEQFQRPCARASSSLMP